MANIGAYSRHKMLEELNTPLFTNKGDGTTPLVYSPAEQRARLKQNAGLETPGGAQVFTMPAPQTATNTVTLTTAQITGGLLIGTPTAAAAYTMPLATALDAALPLMQVGEGFELVVRNDGADTFTITMTTNTGWTLSGDMVIEPAATPAAGESTFGRFFVRKTGAAAYSMFRVGN